jgi:enoyl-[acyl-carrier protein] reductase III
MREFQDKNYWAIILGGSSGLGLATAKKLAKHGMNICVVHRNSRAQIQEIEKHFDEIREENIAFTSFNIDALNSEKRESILSEIKEKLGLNGKVKTLVHSIAKGNLKPMVSDDYQILQNDDFQITINAMAISLYDWFQAIFDNLQKHCFGVCALRN